MRRMFLTAVRLGVLALVSVTAACGDSPSCEDALGALAKRMPEGDRPSDSDLSETIRMCKENKWSGEVRTCVSKASSDQTAMACLAKARPERDRGLRKAKMTEAELNLKAIEKSAKTSYIVDAEFPRASAPLTPATSCCEAGSGGKCKADPTHWHGVDAWDRLDFELPEDHRFRYSYESDGQTMVARAVGDLDCDGTEVTYELRGTAVDGVPTFTLTTPDRPD